MVGATRAAAAVPGCSSGDAAAVLHVPARRGHARLKTDARGGKVSQHVCRGGAPRERWPAAAAG